MTRLSIISPFDALAVLDGLMDPVVVLNHAEEIVYANQEFNRLSGCPETGVDGKRLAEAWPAARSLLDHACYLHSVVSGETSRFVLKFSEASTPYEIALQPLSGCGIAIGLRDYCADFAMPAAAIDRESPNESSHAILHSRMLAHMGSCLRADLGAAETFYQMACILGQLPEVSRATFGTVDHESHSITIHRDFCRNVTSMAGTYRMSDAEIT